jgi:hypothetical protein
MFYLVKLSILTQQNKHEIISDGVCQLQVHLV